jgi:hypothetical protein
MKKYKFCRRRVLFLYREFDPLLTTFNRLSELKRLVIWASRKNLKNPLKLYQNNLDAEEKRLFHYAIASPRLTSFAYRLSQLDKLIGRPPHILTRGSANVYRTKYLTQAAYQS